MTRPRIALLAVSLVAAGLVLGGGLAVRVGAADSTYRKAVLFSEVLSLVLENYVDPVEADRLLDGAYESMLSGLGARSAFLTPAEVDAWVEPAADGNAGPGLAVLKVFGGFQVVAVEEGSAASRAEIAPGDQLRTVDGRDLAAMSLDQGLRALRGEPGSTLSVEVVHPNDGFRREIVELRRALPRGEPYSIAVREGTVVVALHDPRRVEIERFRSELDDAASSGAVRLLFDVRNVVAEDPRVVVPLTALFVEGPVLRLRARVESEPLETVEAPARTSTSPVWDGPIAVLVNGGTAGAAEAFTLILRTRLGASVFGESTYGLGSEPELFRLPDGSGVLIASHVWEVPDGATWDRDGVEPDEQVRGSGSELEDRLRSQLDNALRRFSERSERLDDAAAA